jgi:hypothetical protein
MKSTQLFLHILVATLAFSSVRLFAESSVTFELLATFDYPGFTEIGAYKINDEGFIAGTVYNEPTNTLSGYLRSPSGHLGDPIVDPHGYPYWTGVYGLNNLNQMSGVYEGGRYPDTGFLLSHHNFIEAQFPGSHYTQVYGLNDAGNFSGTYESNGPYLAFANIDDTYTSFSVPGTTFAAAWAINNLNQCVGYYFYDFSIPHGFFRDSDGTMTYPIDAPVVGGTNLYGLNDRGWMVGGCYDAAAGGHGVLFIPGSGVASYDYPGAMYTWFYGVNNKGQICGGYEDGDGSHAFVVRALQARD